MDLLDDLLASSSPMTNTLLSGSEVRRVVRGTRRLARPSRSRTFTLAIGAGLTIAIVGGGSAAALTNPEVRDWLLSNLDDPYVTFTYTAPSGAVCTRISGDVVAIDRDAADALRRWFSHVDLASQLDIDAALESIRSYDEYDRSQIGSDVEYEFAVDTAIVLAAREELQQRGFAYGSIDSWESRTDCTEPTS